jgi:DinB superfamily
MNATVSQCRYLLALSEPILDGLTDAHRALEPAAGAKTAGWLIGHLVVTGDFARRQCGSTPLAPADWRRAFSPGSSPSLRGEDYPGIAELRAAFQAVYGDLCLTFPAADRRLLEMPNPFEPARAAFPTAGDFAAYLMTTHLGYHLGQLVGWRAAAGLGRLRRPDALAA